MQYKTFGFYRLFKAFCSHQVHCILTENRSELPNLTNATAGSIN